MTSVKDYVTKNWTPGLLNRTCFVATVCLCCTRTHLDSKFDWTSKEHMQKHRFGTGNPFSIFGSLLVPGPDGPWSEIEPGPNIMCFV